jgi:K+-sensing histidine kinase KdpD
MTSDDDQRRAPAAAARPRRITPLGGWRGYAVTVALVALATVVGRLARAHLALPDQVMLYLVVVMIAAARFGRGPSLVAATLSIVVFDFFFIPPYFTFTVSEERHVLTFAMMFAVGLVISGLTVRIRRQEHEAEEAKLRASTEEMRSSLLSAVSHDLRTPLATITGAATTLRDGGASVDASQRAELLDMICEEADRLERLVRNLLDMTRLASGALDVRREWVPLEEIVGSALERVEGKLAGRSVRTDLPVDLPLVSADPVLLEQVLVNLLENAAKHTPAATPLEIAARAVGAEIVLEVADRGPGLPPGDEARIFEKFFRGRQARVSGAGLGLAICRGVVDAHGGTLIAANRPGGGALFRVTLPRPGQAPATPPELDGGAAPEEPRP